MSFIYIQERLAGLTQVLRLRITDDPTASGFDHHYLYRDNVNPRLLKMSAAKRADASLDRLPYRQLA